MEKEKIHVNSDKVKKLQETIKKLELQNEQLRAQQLAKNGLIGSQVCDNSISMDSNRADDEDDIIPLNEKDLSDDQTWLYVPEKASDFDVRFDIEEWLRRRVEAIYKHLNDPRSVPVHRNLELDHGEKQSIDTRTFTRPKKRFGMLSTASSLGAPDSLRRRGEEKDVMRNNDLSAMLQSAGLPLKGVLDSILQKHRKTNVVGVEAVIQSEENVYNDISSNNKLDTTYMVQESAGMPVKGLLGDILQKHRKTNVVGVEAVIQTEESVGNDRDAINKLESTYVVQEDDEPDIVLSARRVLNVRECSLPRRSLGSSGVKGSCPTLDQTFQLVACPPLVRGKREMGSASILDCTFSVAKGSSPHSEEDCLSTTSDGSLSSSSRPMNVDDVQQIARLQEESLKQSTPVRGKKSILEVNSEDMPSPILHGNGGSDDNHGYHSDHSSPIGSLTDGGGSRGPRDTCSRGSSLTGGDSLHSSPMTSPHSSTQTLHQIPVHNGLQGRDSQGHPLKAYPRAHSRDNVYDNHEEDTTSTHSKEAMVPDGVSAVPNPNLAAYKLPPGAKPPADLPTRSGRSGMRPPSAPSGIPRPQSRFQSRIPAPCQSDLGSEIQPARLMYKGHPESKERLRIMRSADPPPPRLRTARTAGYQRVDQSRRSHQR